jgi:hypothetical protein
MPVLELKLMQCKFCPGVLKPDVSRKQKVRGFHFFRCQACDRPNIFSEDNPPHSQTCLTAD